MPVMRRKAREREGEGEEEEEVIEEVEKIGQNALNALNVRHLKNVPSRRPMMMMKKVTKEIKKRREATKINWLIPHEKLRRRNERLAAQR